eukprot:9194183-Lingulodinium_polyedra.AAC.1
MPGSVSSSMSSRMFGRSQVARMISHTTRAVYYICRAPVIARRVASVMHHAPYAASRAACALCLYAFAQTCAQRASGVHS